MLVLDDRGVHLDDRVDPIERNEATRAGARHVRVHLGDDPIGRQRRRPGDVDRDAEAAHAGLVGRGHLHEGDIECHAPRGEHARHGGQRDGDIVDLLHASQVPDVAADVPDSMAKRARRPVLAHRNGAIGQEVDQLDPGRLVSTRLERREEDTRRGAGRADEDACARPDAGHRVLRGHGVGAPGRHLGTHDSDGTGRPSDEQRHPA